MPSNFDHLCWVHLGDIDAGAGTDRKAKQIVQELEEAVFAVVESQQLRPNFLFVTGRPSHQGPDNAFDKTADVIENLRVGLSIASENAFIVPDEKNLPVLKRAQFRHLLAGKMPGYAIVRKPIGFPVGIVGIDSERLSSTAKGTENGCSDGPSFSSRAGLDFEFDPVIILTRNPVPAASGETTGSFWAESNSLRDLKHGFLLQSCEQAFWFRAEGGFVHLEAGACHSPAPPGSEDAPQTACFNVVKIDLANCELYAWFMEHHGGRWGPMQSKVTDFNGRTAPVELPWLAKHSLAVRLQSSLTEGWEKSSKGIQQTVMRLDSAVDHERIAERLQTLLATHRFHKLPINDQFLTELIKHFKFGVLEEIQRLAVRTASGEKWLSNDQMLNRVLDSALAAALEEVSESESDEEGSAERAGFRSQ